MTTKQSPWRTLAFIAFVIVAFTAWYADSDERAASNAVTASTVVPYQAPAQTCVTIEFDNRKHARILDHAWDAQRAGAPTRLTIDRGGADQNRKESTDDLPLWSKVPIKKRLKYSPDTGKFNSKKLYTYALSRHDRDEFPPAMSAEGGESADVRYVREAENRDAGREMGKQLTGYPDGTCFQYEPKPRSK